MGSAVEIHGARVGVDGVVLDAAPIVVSAAAGGDKQSPTVTYDGATWVAAWADARSGNGVYAARVSAGGAALDPAGFAVATGLLQEPAVDIASAGSGLSAVVYTRRADVAAPQRVIVRLLTFGDAGVPDVGVRDAGVADVGVADVGVADIGVADVGVADAGVADVAATETGMIDAGPVDTASDAPAADAGAGVPDVVDVGIDVVAVDAPTPDAGRTPRDSGPTADVSASDVVAVDVPTVIAPADSGGLCNVGGAAGARQVRAPWALFALGLVAITRRRRPRGLQLRL
jgi:hypothetical protein